MIFPLVNMFSFIKYTLKNMLFIICVIVHPKNCTSFTAVKNYILEARIHHWNYNLLQPPASVEVQGGLMCSGGHSVSYRYWNQPIFKAPTKHFMILVLSVIFLQLNTQVKQELHKNWYRLNASVMRRGSTSVRLENVILKYHPTQITKSIVLFDIKNTK